MSKVIGEAIKKFGGVHLAVFLCSMLPIVELRGAIPLARFYNMPFIPAFILSYIGNMLPIPFILLFVSSFLKFLKDHNMLTRLVKFVERKAEKNTKGVENMTFWGLAIFVAIPLPGTGGWTGALVANFLGMRFLKALTSIAIGVFIADVVVTAIVYGSISFLSFLA